MEMERDLLFYSFPCAMLFRLLIEWMKIPQEMKYCSSRGKFISHVLFGSRIGIQVPF
jgi:hypothetical protein